MVMADPDTGVVQPAVGGGCARIEPAELRILIVDDSRFGRGIIRSALAVFHLVNTAEAASADDALTILRTYAFDMVLVDFEIPGVDGAALVRSIRWDESGEIDPEVPIIMISSHTEADVVVAARNAGIHEFVVKPVSPRDLYRRIMFTLRNPRPFIRVETYRGPDRRWLRGDGPDGVERRG